MQKGSDFMDTVIVILSVIIVASVCVWNFHDTYGK